MSNDLKSLKQSMDLLKSTPASSKNKAHRFPEFVELWKSVPYLLSTLGTGYVSGRDLEKAIGTRRPPTPAAFSVQQLTRNVSLVKAAHPRLRAMVEKLGQDAQTRRLWLPPTLPYISDPLRICKDPPSKTLIFTSWAAAPSAIATTLNLLVEPRPVQKQKLDWWSFKKNGTSEPVSSVYVIAAPLWRFAQGCDPLAAMAAGGQLSPVKMVAHIRKQLEESKLITVSRRKNKRKSIDVAIELNASVQYRASAQRRPFIQPAKTLLQSVVHAEEAIVTTFQANELAELAAAAPGTCAFRALARTIPQLQKPELREALLGASIDIGNSITRLFQRPVAAAIVEGTRVRRKVPYWRKVLRFCLEHDLQSVLDEYVFLLARENSSQKDPAKLADRIAQDIGWALRTTGVLQAIRPNPREKSYNAAIYARALGEHDTFSEDDAGRQKRPRGSLANPLLAAFNSPFPPFVLVTTSTGQEGLDMHRYCRRLIHWNLPTSPLALEQREGRIDRYLSLGVRTSIAQLNASVQPDSQGPFLPSIPGIDPWALLLDAAKKTDNHQEILLAPFWHFGNDQPIKAIAMIIPFSSEATAWDRLKQEASWYRLVLGQPQPGDLLSRLSNSSTTNQQAIMGVKLDLSPKARTAGKR